MIHLKFALSWHFKGFWAILLICACFSIQGKADISFWYLRPECIYVYFFLPSIIYRSSKPQTHLQSLDMWIKRWCFRKRLLPVVPKLEKTLNGNDKCTTCETSFCGTNKSYFTNHFNSLKIFIGFECNPRINISEFCSVVQVLKCCFQVFTVTYWFDTDNKISFWYLKIRKQTL